MKLIIVRHGETIENKTGIIQGHAQGTLSKKGEKQAKKLALRLLKENIDVIYSSDLRRCKQTIKPYLKNNKVNINYTKELRENDFGIFNGKKRTEFQKYNNSEKYKNWLKKNKIKPNWFDRKLPKGESIKELFKRTSKIIDKIIKKEKGKNVLIITHGGTKKMIIFKLLNKSLKQIRKFKFNNTSVSIIHIKDDGNHKARLLNNTRHLN